MNPGKIGLPTYHSRVERWECDYNDHWNVRFFGRSFQMASECIAAHSGMPNPGAETIATRQMRFHREMRVSAPVEIRSAVLKDAGELDGAIVHLMVSAGELAAAALDLPGQAAHLPQVTPKDVPLAMPRGIFGPATPDTPGPGARVIEAVLGPMRGEDLDHTGKLRFEHLLRLSSNIQHTQLNRLGLTPAYADKHRISRMGVEYRVTRGLTPVPGACLFGQTWFTDIRGKALWATIRVSTVKSDMVALVEMCAVTVDLDTRNAVPVPDFMYEALGRQD